MNYHAFAIPVKGFVVDGKLPASKFAELMEKRRQELPPENAAVMQNMVDSHDTDRLASMIVNTPKGAYGDDNGFDFNRNDSARMSQTYDIRKPDARQRSIQRLVVLMQMTYIGAPMIYYGDEAGMWGGTDPDDRMPMVWKEMKFDPQALDPRGKKREPDNVNFDPEIFDFYKRAIALRREHEALNHGDFSLVAADDKQQLLAFKRQSEKETLLVILNRGEEEAHVELPGADKMKGIFVTQGAVTGLVMQPGKLELRIPALTGAVLKAE
jgi:glycosidase